MCEVKVWPVQISRERKVQILTKEQTSLKNCMRATEARVDEQVGSAVGDVPKEIPDCWRSHRPQ